MSERLLPRYAFFIAGTGRHTERLQAFDRALIDAGPLAHNLVTVSSILPAKCKIISPKEGFKMLIPGQITFCVMARQDTNELSEVASAAIGSVRAKNINTFGYISEYHGNVTSKKEAETIAKKLATEMFLKKLSSSKGSPDLESAHAVSASIKQTNGNEWVCAVALCVFVL